MNNNEYYLLHNKAKKDVLMIFLKNQGKKYVQDHQIEFLSLTLYIQPQFRGINTIIANTSRWSSVLICIETLAFLYCFQICLSKH